jgi:hypothetical protein
LRIDAVQLPNAEGKVVARGLDKKMIVVVHDVIGLTDPVVEFVGVPEAVQEVLTEDFIMFARKRLLQNSMRI